MLRSSSNPTKDRQSPISLDRYREVKNTTVLSMDRRSSRQSTLSDHNARFNDDRIGHISPTNKPSHRSSPRSPTDFSSSNYPKTNADRNTLVDHRMTPDKRTSKSSRLSEYQPEYDEEILSRRETHGLELTRSRSSSSRTSLKSMVIGGNWKYQASHDDQLKLSNLGIENLVGICLDIMDTTSELIRNKHDRREESKSQHITWPLVKLNRFKEITRKEEKSLRQARLYNLMNIVFEAASTSASRSHLVRIWREVTQHHIRIKYEAQDLLIRPPKISYPYAFYNLMRNPNDHLFKIAAHAALINFRNVNELRIIGKDLGVERDEFDMKLIQNSAKAFDDLIRFLQKKRIKQRRDAFKIQYNLVPYEPKKKRGLQANVLSTKFPIVKQAVDLSGFSICPDSDLTCDLLWSDLAFSQKAVESLKAYQKVNHFIAMHEIFRKDLLAVNFKKLEAALPNHYNFLPKTWLSPSEYHIWYAQVSKKLPKNRGVHILKPIEKYPDRKIEIHCNSKNIQALDNYLIQEYIENPYLINGRKFDLEVYVLVTSCDPLRLYLFKDGLVHLSTKNYQEPHPKNAFDFDVHVVNHIPIEDLIENDFENELQSSQSLKYLFKYLKKEHQNIDALWDDIQNLLIKTIFLAEPFLLTEYRKSRPGSISISDSVCFQLLRFNLLIDANLKPWLIEINHDSMLKVSDQCEFNLKIKLLMDTLRLLHFQPSDRSNSIDIERAEKEHRLCLKLGKEYPRSASSSNDRKLYFLKDQLILKQQDDERDNFEIKHDTGFIRLFPVKDVTRMDELISILETCFNSIMPKNDHRSWIIKYSYKLAEDSLLKDIERLKRQQMAPDISHTSNGKVDQIFSSKVISQSQTNSEMEISQKRLRTKSRSRSKSPMEETMAKQVSTQTPPDLVRSLSAASLKQKKTSRKALASGGIISRSDLEPVGIATPGVAANRIIEKKFYSTDSLTDNVVERPVSVKTMKSNDKSQMVTMSSILRATQIPPPPPSNKLKSNTIGRLHLDTADIERLYRFIFDQMQKIWIRYPKKSEIEVDRICDEIIDHWEYHKPRLAQFWFAELDTDKRYTVIEMVWNNVQQIIKETCLIDELIDELPLTRNLKILKRRLLANHGQSLWDFCRSEQTSWESTFVKSSHHLSEIELDCCYRFVELCRDALFVTYRFSSDQKPQYDSLSNTRSVMMITS